MPSNWFADKLGLPAQQGQVRHTYTQQVHKTEPMVSPDGLWMWNGNAWVPNEVPQIPPPPPPPPSNAHKVRGDAGACPQCGDGSQYLKPSSTSSRRCFTCGFIEGRDFEQTNSYDVVRSTGGATAAPGVRQVSTQGNWVTPTSATITERIG